jgi:hypothetical protein
LAGLEEVFFAALGEVAPVARVVFVIFSGLIAIVFIGLTL